jgi:hypothetical protein
MYSEQKGAGIDTHDQQRCAVFLSQIDEIVTLANLKSAHTTEHAMELTSVGA